MAKTTDRRGHAWPFMADFSGIERRALAMQGEAPGATPTGREPSLQSVFRSPPCNCFIEEAAPISDAAWQRLSADLLKH